MKIRVELVSGRSVVGMVVPQDLGPIAAMFEYLDPNPLPIPTASGLRVIVGWIRLLDHEARPHGVNLAHAETITEVPE